MSDAIELPSCSIPLVLASLGPRDRARAAVVCRAFRTCVSELRTSPFQTGKFDQPDEMRESDNHVFEGFPSLALDPRGELLVGFSIRPNRVIVWSMTTFLCIHTWHVPPELENYEYDGDDLYFCRFYGPHHILFGSYFKYVAMNVRTGEVLFCVTTPNGEADHEMSAAFCPADGDVFNARFAVGDTQGRITGFNTADRVVDGMIQ